MNMLQKSKVSLFIAALMAFSPVAQAQRDQISVVGSSTVYPFTTVVAERFGRTTDYATPKVESTGTGGGMKQFCGGVGTEYPDVVNASRRIKQSEIDDCSANGVTEVVEVKVGYDGVVIASSYDHEALQLTHLEIFLALAARVPNEAGTALVENTYTHWNQINAALPNRVIEILGPPPTSGTRDAFLELVMEVGAAQVPLVAAFDGTEGAELVDLMRASGLGEMTDMVAGGADGDDIHGALSHSIREDGVFVETGENDNLIVQKLNANGEAMGIFGFSFLDQNSDSVQGHFIEGVAPEFDAIADGSYSVSRPLYVYVKAQHAEVIPGMQDFIDEFTSERAWGDDGYLTDRGLIPMPEEERESFGSDAANMKAMQL